ncbi:23S rRNA (adenine(1618)-N(6))-methyltransferase RlmF [Flavobacterium sp. RHBU_24]|uniref:23S rRNA (adenine(1618)-N(6))-methyltransferase RlmF n=1 Tax=Flavobacterium sp. RHBU_24 TaxID=3391185 RepID=UPI003984C558
MQSDKASKEKTTLHPRNKNRERYDLAALIKVMPELADHVKPNKYGDDSVDFSSPAAVKLLNTALLKHYYGVENWVFPDSNLTPPIPGRADYIHYIADLLIEANFGRMPAAEKITVLDIGTGASCIYPILGVMEYGFNFVAADIDADSLTTAEKIITSNPRLTDKIELRQQENPAHIFNELLYDTEQVDITMCNPPFHASAADAAKGTQRKVSSLSGKRVKTPELNFAGAGNELVYPGGEHAFIHKMIAESKLFANQCFWFTTLVSKQSNLKGIYKALDEIKATRVKTIPMGTGNKSTRIVAWSLLTPEQQKAWRESRWK